MTSWRILVPLAWMAVLWCFSAMPSRAPGELSGWHVNEVLQNSAHAVVYGILAATWLYALGYDRQAARRAVLFCILYGVMDEIHQSFIPGRTASVIDVLVDATGAVVVTLLAARFVRPTTAVAAPLA